MGVGEDGEEKRKARGRDGEGRGSPALRPVRGVSTAELSQFERRLPRPTSPDRLSVCLVQAEKESQRAPREGVSKKKKKKRTGVEEGERPRGHRQPRCPPPAPEWLQKRRRRRLPREPPGSGAESRLRQRNKNKQLKMAATGRCVTRPPGGTAPSALRLRALRTLTCAPGRGGEAGTEV